MPTASGGRWWSNCAGLMPKLFTLGENYAGKRTGAAIWLRCVVEPEVWADKFSNLA